MKEKLYTLGFNEKEVQVYLYIIEFGISPASEIAQHIGLPKSSVNFLADNLWKKGILKKTFRGKTGFFEADIQHLKQKIVGEIQEKTNILSDIIPLLEEKNKRIIPQSIITFIDGIDNCKKEYLKILELTQEDGKGVFFEFGAHEDLENAFGKKFMSDFIHTRIEKNIFCDSIGSTGIVEEMLQKLDFIHKRSLKVFDTKIFGKISSSLVIYDNTVLILNLVGKGEGICIENSFFTETMKTIFCISKNS